MPCDSVQRNNVELKTADAGLLRKAIESLGYRPETYGGRVCFRVPGGVAIIQNGAISVPESAGDVPNAVKRAYSREVLKTAAAQYDWTLKETATNEFVVLRRR